MGSFGQISRTVRARRGCNCCHKSKPIDSPLGPCQPCLDAGCEYRCGNWYRGTGKDKDGKPNGKPMCPTRQRSQKGGLARASKAAAAKGG